MTKPKTLEQLRTEKERAETQLAQEQKEVSGERRETKAHPSSLQSGRHD